MPKKSMEKAKKSTKVPKMKEGKSESTKMLYSMSTNL